jgi:PiT family inorganic phosphate transporter
MILSPLLWFLVAFIIMSVLYLLLQKTRPQTVSRVFGRLQIVSAGFMGYAHGTNDAQKTMGVIALALAAATQSGTLNSLPDCLSFMKTPPAAPGQHFVIAVWIKVLCSLTMAAGTAAGGWRIIKTLGHKLVKLQPVQGFAAETGAAIVLLATSKMGMPVSTTHVITTSIMGVGATKRMSAVKWSTVERIVWAWIMTLPISAALGYVFVRVVELL